MPQRLANQLTALDIPGPKKIVAARRDHKPSVRAEGHVADELLQFDEGRLQPAGCHVPKLDPPIFARRSEPPPIRAEGQRIDATSVPIVTRTPVAPPKQGAIRFFTQKALDPLPLRAPRADRHRDRGLHRLRKGLPSVSLEANRAGGHQLGREVDLILGEGEGIPVPEPPLLVLGLGFRVTRLVAQAQRPDGQPHRHHETDRHHRGEPFENAGRAGLRFREGPGLFQFPLAGRLALPFLPPGSLPAFIQELHGGLEFSAVEVGPRRVGGILLAPGLRDRQIRIVIQPCPVLFPEDRRLGKPPIDSG